VAVGFLAAVRVAAVERARRSIVIEENERVATRRAPGVIARLLVITLCLERLQILQVQDREKLDLFWLIVFEHVCTEPCIGASLLQND